MSQGPATWIMQSWEAIIFEFLGYEVWSGCEPWVSEQVNVIHVDLASAKFRVTYPDAMVHHGGTVVIYDRQLIRWRRLVRRRLEEDEYWWISRLWPSCFTFYTCALCNCWRRKHSDSIFAARLCSRAPGCTVWTWTNRLVQSHERTTVSVVSPDSMIDRVVVVFARVFFKVETVVLYMW